MDISVKRDGLVLRGILEKPENVDKCPAVIIFHGFMSNKGRNENDMFTKLARACVAKGMAAVRFDFDGHGDSDGEFCDMNVYSEILDASKIIEYVRKLDFVTDIYIIGHSQGALVGGMMAGYYRECISKLVMLAPAATMKDDAQVGSCFGTPYDKYNVPDLFPVKNTEGEHFNVGSMYFRIARTIPIYETTSMFEGKTFIIHGSEDDVVRVEGSKRYTECMDNVKLVIVEGEGHGLDDHSLDDVVKMSVDFLV